jgi:hypothetical protein
MANIEQLAVALSIWCSRRKGAVSKHSLAAKYAQ